MSSSSSSSCCSEEDIIEILEEQEEDVDSSIKEFEFISRMDGRTLKYFAITLAVQLVATASFFFGMFFFQ